MAVCREHWDITVTGVFSIYNIVDMLPAVQMCPRKSVLVILLNC